jgi:PAS domain S-box-containing protein
MKEKPTRGRNKSSGLWLAGTVAAVLTAGLLSTWWAATRADRQMREDLLLQGRMVGQALSINSVKKLSGTEADLQNPDYRQLKEQLANVRQANKKCRFLYLMGRKADGSVFFYVDSEPVDSKDYSPPGQVYEEVSESFRRVLDTQVEDVEGPVKDRWGLWVSALVPLTDPATGELIAVLGMDIDARAWKWEVTAHAALPASLILALLTLLALGIIATHSRAKLRASEARYAITFAAVNDGLWDWQVPSGRVFFSALYFAMLGYEDGELPATYASWRSLVHPEDIDRVEQELQRSVEKGEGFAIDLRMKMKSGAWRWVSIRGKAVERDRDGKALRMVGTLSDITARRQDEEKIQKLLSEKELILKEVHHRVKNNMSVIHGLLTMQANAQKDPAVKSILQNAAGRVQSMLVLYDKLYRSEKMNAVSIKEYLPALIDEIFGIFPQKAAVKIRTQIDDIILSPKMLSPLGVIINELITNAMKYAFAGRNDGVITVTAAKRENRVSLLFADNGIGLPESFVFENSSGFGFQLINMLVKQIDGSITVEKRQGTRFIIEFEA